MQNENNKPENLRKLLLTLINIGTNIYKGKLTPTILMKKYLEKEVTIIKSLNQEELSLLIKVLNKIYNINDSLSLIHYLINQNNIDAIIARISYILEEQLLTTNLEVDDDFTNKLNLALKDILACQNEFEFALRNIYIDLLQKHLSSSYGMSDEYLTYLNNLAFNIRFIYPNAWFNKINISISDPEKGNINVSYLHSKIEETIKTLLTYKDEELEIDLIYAKAISLQIYLRSLLIILNDEHEMIKYENMYNNLETNETTAKRLIRNAFIANYMDTQEYTLTKKGE